MDWCPLATRDDNGANDAGAFVGGPPRGVLHTTEGWSAHDARGAYAEKNAWPHFTATFEKKQFQLYQHLSISVAARALEHRRNTVETNRQSAIQVEIVGFAREAASFTDPYLDGIAKLMRWIESNANVARVSTVKFVLPGEQKRLTDAAWLAYEGWCGHQHVPHNEHEDPGPINIAYLLG